ncbi:hypothetical protein [Flavobacterium ovatum]|uniref:hypothetical protein n=1 Tax=Flavobacterium ovatum TaxID=1928857 RepID=UPI00344B69DF
MKLFCCLFLFVCSIAIAQQSPKIQVNGRVSSTMVNLEGVYVINLKTEQMVQTDKSGDFVIPAVKGDTLVFSMFQYTRVKVVLTDENLAGQKVIVTMLPVMNYLDEVVIKTYSHVNAVSLGIISSSQRSYSPAERKLKAASDFGGSGGASVGLDPLLNLISGRTAMLKKELEVEKKEKFIRQLEYMFEQAHFVGKLKIPLLYVKGFIYYAVENPKFTKVLETKNKVSIEFLLAQLAEMYKESIAVQTK